MFKYTCYCLRKIFKKKIRVYIALNNKRLTLFYCLVINTCSKQERLTFKNYYVIIY